MSAAQHSGRGWWPTAADSIPTDSARTRAATPGDRATHVLVESDIVARVRRLSRETRVAQSEYFREALADLLAKHCGRSGPVLVPEIRADGALRSVVFRVDPRALDELVALSKRTRVRQSEYIREALMDLLEKHGRGVRA